MTDRARELLELSLQVLELHCSGYTVLSKEIRAYLADTNPSETINSQEVDRSEPKVPFVRLTEEEVNSLTYAPLEPYELICAVENMLERKNRDR